MSGRDHPNILFVISDQERHWSWLPPSLRLPWRQRLQAEGLTLDNHYTHSSPCSPSRTTMQTGLHVPQHGVADNTIFPWHHSLDTAVPTVGSVLRDAGYRSSYIGKWHVSYGPTPPMEAYGYSDWEGNDQHYMGWAGTGVRFTVSVQMCRTVTSATPDSPTATPTKPAPSPARKPTSPESPPRPAAN